MTRTPEPLFFAGLSGKRGERCITNEWETYEGHELNVGLELYPLAGNGTSESEKCGCTGPYKGSGW